MGRKPVEKKRINNPSIRDKWIAELIPVYMENGLKKFTMNDISKELGVSKATIYKHFTSQTEILEVEKSGVSAVYLPQKDVFRISMTAQMINDARSIAFLVFGENKAEAIQHVLKGEHKPTLYPAQLIDKKADWVEQY